MPVVHVEMWPGRTRAQKAELARAITDAIVTIAHTTPDQVTVVFEDVAKENWAVSGVLASEAPARS
ncbi:MAG: tautomerase family protein [Chloroflexi bacterium]|nr:tautomerase family protein [Chloroflexota bacterium]